MPTPQNDNFIGLVLKELILFPALFVIPLLPCKNIDKGVQLNRNTIYRERYRDSNTEEERILKLKKWIPQ